MECKVWQALENGTPSSTSNDAVYERKEPPDEETSVDEPKTLKSAMRLQVSTEGSMEHHISTSSNYEINSRGFALYPQILPLMLYSNEVLLLHDMQVSDVHC
jgi:hypothetical protein